MGEGDRCRLREFTERVEIELCDERVEVGERTNPVSVIWWVAALDRRLASAVVSVHCQPPSNQKCLNGVDEVRRGGIPCDDLCERIARHACSSSPDASLRSKKGSRYVRCSVGVFPSVEAVHGRSDMLVGEALVRTLETLELTEERSDDIHLVLYIPTHHELT